MDDPRSPVESKLGSQLMQLVAAIEASGRAILPQTNDALLQSIIEAAVKIFDAAAASILLVNEQEQLLEFKVACGAADRELVGTKIPLDKGIAGYVAMTGQPLAISNVRQDTRFNQGFAESTGYVPNSILATPLLAGERVIGVMEVLDKVSAASFGVQDMDLMGIFARQAALAIDQSQKIDLLQEALISGLKRLSLSENSARADELLEALDHAGTTPTSSEILALADLFNSISASGDAETRACIQILEVFARYQHSMHQAWS